MFKHLFNRKPKLTKYYRPEFIQNVNQLFNQDILTDEMIKDGYVDPTVPLKALGYRILYDAKYQNLQVPHLDYQNKTVTISNADPITRQRFALAKALGKIVYRQANLQHTQL